MTDVQTAEQPAEAQKPKVGQALATWQDFNRELKERDNEIASLLPQHVSKARFNACALAAVKQNPSLLEATPRSLFASISRSAQDGLLPDGREGVILPYYDKKKSAKVAQWIPMAYGLRKRARELDQIIIDAQVVHANDKFVLHQGDDPHIEHLPAQLGTPRGEMIGAYAIFKREGGVILHREVMDKTQIETVKKQSKAPDSLMWGTFTEEAWRKTVVRRGIKSVPCSEKLETIIRRDDELFNIEQVALEPPEQIPPRPSRQDDNPFDRSQIEEAEVVEVVQEMQKQPEPQAQQPAPQPEPAKAQESEKPGPTQAYDDWLGDMEKAREACKNMGELNSLHNAVGPQLDEKDVNKWNGGYEVKARSLLNASKQGKK